LSFAKFGSSILTSSLSPLLVTGHSTIFNTRRDFQLRPLHSLDVRIPDLGLLKEECVEIFVVLSEE
jgi:hypothetical protein